MKKLILAVAMATMAVLNVQSATHAKVQLWEGGPYWATTNIGADKPEDYGLYFWWGDTEGHSPGYNFGRDNSAIYTYMKGAAELQSAGWMTSSGVLTPAHDTAHVRWGGAWRMPTKAEWEDIIRKCDWKWMTQNGVFGFIVCGRGAYASNSIFLPAAGHCVENSLYKAGLRGYYWSSRPYTYPYTDRLYSWELYFESDYPFMSDTGGRYEGMTIRPVQDFNEGGNNGEATVIVNFRKEAEEPDQSCDKAWWYLSNEAGSLSYNAHSGEAVSMPIGTYTATFHSGESAFADPEPIQIVIDGTESCIERDVVISRKLVWFSCVYYNQSNKEYGMQPITNEMNLNHFCWWRLDGGEWLRGKVVQVPTGTHRLELRVEDDISLMIGMEAFAKTIVLDGTEASHTEYINALGENGAKVSFRFKGSSTKLLPPDFDESKVLVDLRCSRGSMSLHAGDYCLPQGRYSSSFQYAGDAAGLWHAPASMSFEIDEKDKKFTLNFVDSDDIETRSVYIWFDANEGMVDTPLLRYASSWRNGNRTSLEYVPEAWRDGFKFTGWYLHKTGDSRLNGFVPSWDDDDVETTHVFGEDASINGIPAIHVYARWTNLTQSWMSRFLSIFTASGGDIATAAAMTAANGCKTVGECYALGINPEDPDDDFRITSFEMKDGKPVITLNHTEDGSGNSFLPRVKTLGAKSLGASAQGAKSSGTAMQWDDMTDVADPDAAGYRFFKVEVEMP